MRRAGKSSWILAATRRASWRTCFAAKAALPPRRRPCILASCSLLFSDSGRRGRFPRAAGVRAMADSCARRGKRSVWMYWRYVRPDAHDAHALETYGNFTSRGWHGLLLRSGAQAQG